MKKEMGENDPNPMETRERKAVSTFDRPDEHGAKGSTSAADVARPRDREGHEGDAGMVPGFTGTSSSGSQSARSLYGMAPDEETDKQP